MKLHFESLQSEKTGYFGQAASTVSGGESGDLEQLKEKIRREQQLVLQLEMDLQTKDAALEEARDELEGLRSRGESIGPGASSFSRIRRDSTDSRYSDTFLDHQEVWIENNKMKGDLDHALRENRRLSSRIRSWESELERGQDLDQEGLRNELTRAIETLQIKEHKLEGIQEENLTLLEERDSLQLRLSSLMRQMESAANSRAMTPVPGGGANSGSFSSPGYGVLDPQQQILELNSKLSELRKLNYSLDVELQKERGQRAQQHIRVMEPRSREAERMLSPSSSSSPSTDSPVKHL